METKQEPQSYTVGVIIIIATVFAMSFADAVVKYVSSDLPLWQIYVVRSLIAIPIICSFFFVQKHAQMRPVSLFWTMMRSFILALMYIAIYAAAPILSLSVIGASLYTGPLFIVLFSAVIVGESVGPVRCLAVLVGFVGVLVMIRPAADDFTLATLIPIIAAILYALAAVITRTKCLNEKPMVLALALNFSLLFVGLGFSAALLLWNPDTSLQAAYPFLLGYWIEMGPREWSIVTLLAVLIVGIGIGLAKAYQSGPLAVIATFDYSYLIFAAFWSVVLFSDWPDTSTLIGMLLIAIAGILVTNSEAIVSLMDKRILRGGKA